MKIDINFDEKAINKEVNADVSITLREGMSVKFHSRPVYEVISEELHTGKVIAIPDSYFDKCNTLPYIATVQQNDSNPDLPTLLSGSIVTVRFPPPPESDLDIAHLLSDQAAMEHLLAMSKICGGGWTVDDAAGRRTRQEKEFTAGQSFNGAIYTNVQNHFAGIGGFRSIDWWNRSAEMGIILSPTFWRRGICVDVHFTCLRFAFEDLCLNRIEFKTASSNTGMIRFCENVLNAKHEGTLRDAFPAKSTNDAFKLYSNVELYSVMSYEWPDLKIALQARMNFNNNS